VAQGQVDRDFPALASPDHDRRARAERVEQRRRVRMRADVGDERLGPLAPPEARRS
jgi:hypothetical protein